MPNLDYSIKDDVVYMKQPNDDSFFLLNVRNHQTGETIRTHGFYLIPRLFDNETVYLEVTTSGDTPKLPKILKKIKAKQFDNGSMEWACPRKEMGNIGYENDAGYIYGMRGEPDLQFLHRSIQLIWFMWLVYEQAVNVEIKELEQKAQFSQSWCARIQNERDEMFKKL